MAAEGDLLDRLHGALGSAGVRKVEPRYLEEPRGRFPGRARGVVLPATVDECAEIIRAAAADGTPIVPYGGGTGLVGGQTAGGGVQPLLLSLERMDRIRGIWPEEGVLVAEAGCILQDVQAAAADAGLLFPLALAAQGSCRIGGNLATNAGGVNVLRYGNARDLCLGLEAVLANGSIIHGLGRLRKDNTGYDLRNLLIGSEGTLGVITAASLRLFPRPTSEAAAIFQVRDPAAALELLGLARSEVGEGVSAFELISRTGLEFLAEHVPDQRQPFAAPPDWCVLVDLGMFGGAEAASALEAIFAAALERGISDDGVIAASEAQRADFWAVRERIPEANRKVGAIASHDISLPLGALADFLRAAGPALGAFRGVRVNCFGHVGDGNLHYNVFPPKGETADAWEDRRAEITETVHEHVHTLGGSISAEHGIGRAKVAELERYGDPGRLAAMRAIKAALDPHGILNPGAVLAQPTSAHRTGTM